MDNRKLLKGTVYHGWRAGGRVRVSIFSSPGRVVDFDNPEAFDWGAHNIGAKRLAFEIIRHATQDEEKAERFHDVFVVLVLQHLVGHQFFIEADSVRAIVDGLEETQAAEPDPSRVEALVDETVFRLTT